jgi:Arc/MetJ family transcription regulator
VTFSEEITTLALELAKSLWAELGVGGGQRRHDWQALDLEPLIILTASLAATDDAFVTRTIRWCALNSLCLSIIRLRNLSRRFSSATRESLDMFLRAQESSGAARIASGDWPDLKRLALIQLRLRALVGVGARAEALKLMLADPEEPKAMADIERNAAFETLDCVHALDALSAAGVVKVEPAGHRFLYRLAHPSDLTTAVNGVPLAFPDWVAVFKVIDAIREYAARDGEDPPRRVAPARKLTDRLRTHFVRLGVAAEVPDILDGTSVTAFEEWARSFVAEHAGATLPAAVNEASYSVHRLAHGGWIATVTVAGGQPRSLALSDTPVLRPERRKQRRSNPDALGDAALVVEMMLQDLLTRAVQRRLGSTVSRKAASEAVLPAVSREFAAELLLPMHAGEATSFSERFLQRWLANRRHWHDISA